MLDLPAPVLERCKNMSEEADEEERFRTGKIGNRGERAKETNERNENATYRPQMPIFSLGDIFRNTARKARGSPFL